MGPLRLLRHACAGARLKPFLTTLALALTRCPHLDSPLAAHTRLSRAAAGAPPRGGGPCCACCASAGGIAVQWEMDRSLIQEVRGGKEARGPGEEEDEEEEQHDEEERRDMVTVVRAASLPLALAGRATLLLLRLNRGARSVDDHLCCAMSCPGRRSACSSPRSSEWREKGLPFCVPRAPRAGALAEPGTPRVLQNTCPDCGVVWHCAQGAHQGHPGAARQRAQGQE